MTICGAASIFFGGLMLLESPGYLQMMWLKIKLLFVALVIAYHVYCYKLMRDFAAQRNARSAKWFRGFNELPSLLLVVIVILAVVKHG
jgi:putative membrane protein